MELDSVLAAAVAAGASDVHLKVGKPPMVRRDGEIVSSTGAPLTDADLEVALATVTADAPQRAAQFREIGDLDLAYISEGLPRFRVNVFRQRGAISMALRIIPREVPRFLELGYPRLWRSSPASIVVVRDRGDRIGNTMTLAAMLDHINRTRRSHIVTIEDPIEILHSDHQSIVNQREVGLDTESFGQALRRALRQDPDTIMIGELRDAETAQTALQAAESGHLVFSTLHTIDAAETVGRMIEFFPETKQQAVRSIMAGVLRGVVSQRLLPKIGGGRCAVVEAMVVNARIADLIREGRPDEITDAIAEGEYFEMQTFEQALIERVLAHELEQDVAADAATNKHDFLVALDRETKRRSHAEQAHAETDAADEPELGDGVTVPGAVDASALRLAAPLS